MDGEKRRNSYSFNFKLKALKSLTKNHGNTSKTAKEMKVSRGNLQRWKKEEEKIKEQVKSTEVSSRKKRRSREGKAKYPLLEKALLTYVKERREKKENVDGKKIRRYATSIFSDLYPDCETPFKASNGFLHNFLKRNNLVRRRVTSVGQKIPPNATELCESFLDVMKDINDGYEVVLNMDETPLYFDLPSNNCIDFKGVKTVTMKTTGNEKLRYTVVLTAGVRKNGDDWAAFRLPPMIIFKNLVKPPKGDFPHGMVVVGSKGGTMTTNFMVNNYIPKILSRRPGGYFQSDSTLLILDSATSHTGEGVYEFMEKQKIDCRIIQGGLTPLLQFMDTHVNRAFKNSMRSKWENWIETGNVEYTKGGKRKRASYELIAKWVHETWITTGTKELIVKGFRENGYIDFKGSTDHLHSRLQETLIRGIPEEVIREVDEYLREMEQMDNDEIHNDDDEIQESGESSDHDQDPFATTDNGVDFAVASTSSNTTSNTASNDSDTDTEIDVDDDGSESTDVSTDWTQEESEKNEFLIDKLLSDETL